MSDNDPAACPDTPFQILYVNNIDYDLVGGGVVATATASFTVSPGTPLYLPIFNATNGEPVVGTFPACWPSPWTGPGAKARPSEL